MLWCDLLVDRPDRCPDCGTAGRYRDTVVRPVTDLPIVGYPVELRVRVPRYRCGESSCGREVFRHSTDQLARAGSSTTRRCARHVLRRLMIDRTPSAAIARELGLYWDTVNSIAVDATAVIVTAEARPFDQVRVIGVDEHRWAHTRHAAGDGFVTVIVGRTREALLTERQQARLDAVFADEAHIAVVVTWRIYQDIIGTTPIWIGVVPAPVSRR